MGTRQGSQVARPAGPREAPPDGLLLVDKASGMSSHDIVGRARRALRTRSVGHAGTLDPMATGLLVLGVGQGTKLLRYLVLDDKRYEATVELGVTTDSLDADGQVSARAPVPEGLDVPAVQVVADRFLGVTAQRAPVISAIKRGGEALYKKVRRGEEVQAPVREVQLHALDVLGVEGSAVRLRVHCGKGFYVRSLARDLAEALGTVGHLSALRRTSSGGYAVAGAVATDVLQAARDDDAARVQVRATVLGLAQAAASIMPTRVVDAEAIEHLRHGRPAPLVSGDPAGEAQPAGTDDGPGGAGADGVEEPVAFVDAAGTLVAIGRVDAQGLHSRRGFPPPE